MVFLILINFLFGVFNLNPSAYKISLKPLKEEIVKPDTEKQTALIF